MSTPPNPSSAERRELPKITLRSDTRDVLAHASREAAQRPRFIVDVDAHVTETPFWSDIVDCIDNDVIRKMAASFRVKPNSPPGLLNVQPGMQLQDAYGRIPHQSGILEETDPNGPHRIVQSCGGPWTPWASTTR